MNLQLAKGAELTKVFLETSSKAAFFSYFVFSTVITQVVMQRGVPESGVSHRFPVTDWSGDLISVQQGNEVITSAIQMLLGPRSSLLQTHIRWSV